MEPIRLTDYLAVLPSAHGVSLVDPSQQLAAKLFLKLPELVTATPNSNRALQQRVAADFSLLALVLTTLTVVATVVLNWSR